MAPKNDELIVSRDYLEEKIRKEQTEQKENQDFVDMCNTILEYIRTNFEESANIPLGVVSEFCMYIRSTIVDVFKNNTNKYIEASSRVNRVYESIYNEVVSTEKTNIEKNNEGEENKKNSLVRDNFKKEILDMTKRETEEGEKHREVENICKTIVNILNSKKIEPEKLLVALKNMQKILGIDDSNFIGLFSLTKRFKNWYQSDGEKCVKSIKFGAILEKIYNGVANIRVKYTSNPHYLKDIIDLQNFLEKEGCTKSEFYDECLKIKDKMEISVDNFSYFVLHYLSGSFRQCNKNKEVIKPQLKKNLRKELQKFIASRTFEENNNV